MSKGHVLVVEDDEETRRLVNAILRKSGYEVTLTPDGAAGLEALEARGCDLILLDMVLPRMSGWAFLRRLATQPSIPPVIVMSAKYSRSEPLGDLERYIWAYVKKPFTSAALVETCDRVGLERNGDGFARGNRRGSPRYPTQIPVGVFSEAGMPLGQGQATDVSLTGAQLEIDAPIAEATPLELRFERGRGAGPMSIRARVIWAAIGAAGVVFVALTDEQEEQIAGLLESTLERGASA